MDKVKELEKIQLEYDLYEVGDVGDIGRMINILFSNLEEVDVARSCIELERKRNRRKRIVSDVLGKHAGRFGYLDPYYYCMDDFYLDRKCGVLDRYYDQLNDIHHEIDDDNYQELYRLMSFTRKKTRDYRVAIEKEREVVKKNASEGTLDDTESLDDGKVFAEWFNEALPKASYVERVEKVKK